MTIDTGRPPSRCAPAYVVVLLTSSRTPNRVSTRNVRIATLGPQQVTLSDPTFFSAPPDAVRAYAIAKTGAQSRSVSVAVRP